MAHLEIITDGFGAFKDVKVTHTNEVVRIAGLAAGVLTGGEPIVGIGVSPAGDPGSMTLVQTKLALFLTAAEIFKERFGDPRNSATAKGSAAPNVEMIEKVAEAIYNAMRKEDPEGRRYSWVPRGNSQKQDLARVLARAALRAI
jgi:hypothetical protein